MPCTVKLKILMGILNGSTPENWCRRVRAELQLVPKFTGGGAGGRAEPHISVLVRRRLTNDSAQPNPPTTLLICTTNRCGAIGGAGRYMRREFAVYCSALSPCLTPSTSDIADGGEGRNRPSLVFHKPLEINRLWHR